MNYNKHQKSCLFIFGFLAIILLGNCILKTMAQEPAWKPVNGPYGGSITALYATEDTLYVATANGGVFKSTNGGRSWTAMGTDFTGQPQAFAVFEKTLYMATVEWEEKGGGIYRSEDEGKNWSLSEQGLPTDQIRHLIVSEKVLFAASPRGVFRTMDEGKTFKAVNTGLSDLHILSMLSVDNILYVGTASGGVFRSENQGENWTQINNGLPRAQKEWETPYWIPALTASGMTLYAGTREGVYRSGNRGDSWEKANSGIEKYRVIALATSGQTVYAGTLSGGVFRSEDKGENWVPMNARLPSMRVAHLVVTNRTLYAGIGRDYQREVAPGVFRYDADMNRWQHTSVGLERQRIRSLVTLDETLYVGTADSGVFQSKDGGEHFLPVSNGLPSLGIWSLARLGRTLYAGVSNGYVLRLEDQSDTWMLTESRPWTEGSASASLTRWKEMLYAGGNGVFRSDDGGKSWQSLNEGLDRPNVRSILVLNGVLYVGTTDGVFRLKEDDREWIPSRQSFDTQVLTALRSVLYAGTPEGVFRSIDKGKNWTSVNTGLKNLDIHSFVTYGTTLYAGTKDGVFSSKDGGNTWTSAGLEGKHIESLLVADNILYAGGDNGVFRAILGELSSKPQLLVISPQPNEIVPYRENPVLAVQIENHTGGWRWQLDKPFPESGQASGNPGTPNNRVTLTELKPGQNYTLYVALVDEQGDMLNPPVTVSVSFSTSPKPSGTPIEDTKIVFVSERDENKEIYVMKADGSDLANLTHNPASDYSPVWSPGGSKIAFISNRDGDHDLFVMDADGKNLRKLTHDSREERQPKWSYDGTKVAFLSRKEGGYVDEVHVVDVDGSNHLSIAEGEAFSWSPLDSRIAFISGNIETFQLYVIEADGSSRKLLTQTSGGSLYNGISYTKPVWAPDASYLLFSEGHRTAHGWIKDWDVFRISFDGDEKQPLGLGASPLAFSPNGTKLLFQTASSGPVGISRLFVTERDGSNKQSLDTSHSYLSHPSWSPDGKKIVAESSPHGKPDLYVVNANGTGRIRLTEQGGTEPNWQSFPNTALPPMPRIHIVSPVSGEEFPAETTSIALEVRLEGYSGPWQWRLNTPFPLSGQGGGQMVFSGNTATIHGLESGLPFTVYVALVDEEGNLLTSAFRANRTFSVAYPSSSPELANTRIAFVSRRNGNSEIYTINVDGTELKRLTNSPLDDWYPSWSPDARKIVFGSRREKNWEIYTMNADGTNLKRLTHTPQQGELGPCWSPDGKKITYVRWINGREDICVMNSDGSEPTPLTHTGKDKSPSWSSDGNKIYFQSTRDGKNGLYVMNADGTQVRQIANVEEVILSSQVSPRGNEIAFTPLTSASWDIYVMDTEGRHIRRLTDTPSSDTHPAWSSDGTKIVFGSNQNRSGGIFIMNSDGTDVTRLTSGEFESMPAWSPIPPQRKRMDYTFPVGLSLFSPTLRTTTIFQNEEAITVSEDGGVFMASHLIRLGATVCISVQEQMKTVVGHEGKILFGHDFPIKAGNTYIVNMLESIVVTLEGISSRRVVSSPSPKRIPSVWTFVVAGNTVLPSFLPSGTYLRVVNTRTGKSLEGEMRTNNDFIIPFIDMSQQTVVSEGDKLRIELVTMKGEVLLKKTERRISRNDLRQAFTIVKLDTRPQQTRLLQNFPNPFNPVTWIPFELSEASEVEICIYDLQGRLLRVLHLGYRQPGYYFSRNDSAQWNGRNTLGESVASGIYFCEMQAGSVRSIRRMVLQR